MSNSSSQIMFPQPLITAEMLGKWIRTRGPVGRKPPLKGWLMFPDRFAYVVFRGGWGYFNLYEIDHPLNEVTPFEGILAARNLVLRFPDGRRVRLSRKPGLSSIEISSPGFQRADPNCTLCKGVGSYSHGGVPKACECLHDDE